ncbi:MAG TPA: hypothetical protein VE077_14290 [Candidatus Methylomirabilis sp.]|nr:hypothetical protein [Candidatus Methylomirabilis sp.]
MFEVLKLDKTGHRHFVKAFPTLEAARATVQSLGEHWPGAYLIVDQATSESIAIEMSGETEQD